MEDIVIRLRDIRTTHADAREAADEIERLRAIVGRLPKTADGVPVVSGDKVYWFSHYDPSKPILELTFRNGQSASLHNPYRESHHVCRCYSTRAAAEAARHA